MTNTITTTGPAEGLQLLRVTPQQDRAEKRLQEIRQAARELIAELGRDRFTTNDLAVRAGCSIGTVYRYFADRVAILDDLYPDRCDGLTCYKHRHAGDGSELQLDDETDPLVARYLAGAGRPNPEHAAAVQLAAEVQL